MENRYLAKRPTFSVGALFVGEYTSDYETYITDHFFLRDSWITLKSYTELALMKTENNGVYIGKNGTLLERFDEPDQSRVDANINAVNALVENAGVSVYLALIPGAVKIWEDKLPAFAPNYDQGGLIEYIYANTTANTVDIYGALSTHSNEYIFYRTDHHWTTLGAYYGYTSFMDALGRSPSPLSSFDRETVSTGFYGTVYSSSGVRWVRPDEMEIFVKEPAGMQISNYSDGNPNDGLLYDYEYLEKKDKYSLFFGGITPLLQITTQNTEAPSLLILRDSFADANVPFLLEHFSEIHVMDLRYNRTGVKVYLEEHDIDMVLLMYSVSNFSGDANIALAGR